MTFSRPALCSRPLFALTSSEISWHDGPGSESRDSTMANGGCAGPHKRECGDPQNSSAPPSIREWEASWTPVPQSFRDTTDGLPPPWEAMFGPLRRGLVDDFVLVGQCGQSIDARIAT